MAFGNVRKVRDAIRDALREGDVRRAEQGRMALARRGRGTQPQRAAPATQSRPTLTYAAPVGLEGRLKQAKAGQAPWWAAPGGMARGNADMPNRPPGPAGWNWTPEKAAAWNREVQRQAIAQEARKAEWEELQAALRDPNKIWNP